MRSSASKATGEGHAAADNHPEDADQDLTKQTHRRGSLVVGVAAEAAHHDLTKQSHRENDRRRDQVHKRGESDEEALAF
jgi:hypothetical protein